jgi:hypothetical protein
MLLPLPFPTPMLNPSEHDFIHHPYLLPYLLGGSGVANCVVDHVIIIVYVIIANRDWG